MSFFHFMVWYLCIGAVLAVCGGYQLLGHHYALEPGVTLPGVGLLDLHTERGEGRLIGNVAIEVDGRTLLGAEALAAKGLIVTGPKVGSRVLPQDVWNKLNYSWAIFFVVMGVINIWVAYQYDLDTWVTFKLFGGMGLMFVFVLAQALYLSRYMKDTEDTKGPQA